MSDLLSTLIPFFGVLLVLVLVHELGHFVTAKMAGVTVKEFGFGYPPRLFAKRFKGTDYSINLLPLGGFVKLAGEEDPSEAGSFAGKSIGARLVILTAGPAMNAVLPIALMTAVLMFPREVIVEPVRIGAVAPGSPAEAAGIQPGDLVKAIADRPVTNRQELSYGVQLNMGSPVELTIERNGQTRIATVVPRWAPPAGEGPTGITFQERVRIEAVQPGSPAEAAVIKPGDLLVQINGKQVNILQEVSAALRQSQGSEVTLTLARGSERYQAKVTPRLNPPEGEGPLGVLLGVPDRELSTTGSSLPEAFGGGIRRSFDMLTLFKNGIYSSFSSGNGAAVTGPIGIAQATGEVAKAGLPSFLEWAALLSMNLAILNILPIPMLDGGRVVFVLLEWVRRGRRVSPEREGLVHLVGFVVLMGLILIISYNDVLRLVKGESLFP